MNDQIDITFSPIVYLPTTSPPLTFFKVVACVGRDIQTGLLDHITVDITDEN